MIQVFHISDVDFWREFLLKKIQYIDVIDAISEIKWKILEIEKISLIITEEQKDTLLSLFGYYDEVEATQTDEITESPKAHKKP
jgi:hypothetical protein